MTTERLADFRLTTLREDTSLNERFWPQKQRIWPGFMFEDVVANKIWPYLSEDFAHFQLYLVNEAGAPVAVAQTVPLAWDGTLEDLPIGWIDGFQRGVNGLLAGLQPNTLMPLEIAIQPEYQGQGVSYRMVNAVRALAQQEGYHAAIVAVRPSLKSRYPLTPMARYVGWQREDGAPFDPWLRVHWRCGGEILKVAHPSMVIEAPVADWESWSDLAFPESGEYVVAGALAPVEIDLRLGVGRYVEPNIWVHHPFTTPRLMASA